MNVLEIKKDQVTLRLSHKELTILRNACKITLEELTDVFDGEFSEEFRPRVGVFLDKGIRISSQFGEILKSLPKK